MIGKLPIIFGGLGLALYTKRALSQHRIQIFELLTAVGLAGSVWLAHSSSAWFWQIVSPLQSFQFPWRFISFALFGLSYFAGHVTSSIKHPYIKALFLFVLTTILIMQSSRFFIINQHVSAQDDGLLDSPSYIREVAAYKVPEYLPRSVDRTYWLNMEKSKPTDMQIAELKRQYAGYKPSLMLYTISRTLSIATFLCLLCLTRFTATRKRA
jgi:hypothetical protein